MTKTPRITSGGSSWTSEKDAYLVRGYDADRFFITLSQSFGCFPPAFADRPFTHVAELLETLTDFPTGGGDQKQDFLTTTKTNISQAIDTYERGIEVVQEADGDEISHVPHEALDMAANALLMAGKYDELQAIGQKLRQPTSPTLTETLAWSHIMPANALVDKAKTKSGAVADRLFAEAGEKYREALTIKPNEHDALYNWGNALSDLAKTKSGAEADRLFTEAGEKYRRALTVKPDLDEAHTNWGTALFAQAKTKSGAEADRLFTEAGEKYRQALTIKPNVHEVLYNWGGALFAQAKTKSATEAERLFREAGEKYRQAVTIKPDYNALYNWGTALSDLAKTKSGAEADRLFTEAGEKYRQALTIKPDDARGPLQLGHRPLGTGDDQERRGGRPAVCGGHGKTTACGGTYNRDRALTIWRAYRRCEVTWKNAGGGWKRRARLVLARPSAPGNGQRSGLRAEHGLVQGLLEESMIAGLDNGAVPSRYLESDAKSETFR